MKRSDVELLSTEELWVLHRKVTTTLKAKIIAEKKVLEDRLSRLNARFRVERTSKLRSADLIRLFSQNFEIRNNLRKPGRAAGRSHAGLPHSLSRGNRSTIFESN
jgi:hypothetical protein